MSLLLKESAFLRHESCPQCGSKDNLGRYTDGHAWCFGCGYYEPAKWMPSTKTEEVSDEPKSSIQLPEGCVATLPYKAQNWLKSYDITREEVREHQIQWCEPRQALVFPIYDLDVLLAYQLRHFDSGPKWTTKGDVSNILHIIGLTEMPDCGILIVEDIVSAIKCSRHIPTMPLFGNHISTANLQRLNKITDKLYIWLDPDMKKQSVKLASSATEIGLKVRVIYSNQDPKSESDTRIMYETGQ